MTHATEHVLDVDEEILLTLEGAGGFVDQINLSPGHLEAAVYCEPGFDAADPDVYVLGLDGDLGADLWLGDAEAARAVADAIYQATEDDDVVETEEGQQ